MESLSSMISMEERSSKRARIESWGCPRDNETDLRRLAFANLMSHRDEEPSDQETDVEDWMILDGIEYEGGDEWMILEGMDDDCGDEWIDNWSDSSSPEKHSIFEIDEWYSEPEAVY